MFANLVGWLDKDRTIARPTFNRWMVPPAALCIHLSIGMAYGFSVFWLPLTRAVGIDHSVPFPPDMPWHHKLVTTNYDWDKPLLGWLYTLFFVFLGSSAALFGRWLEHAGPRKAGMAAMVCWCGGLALGALGIYAHQLWILWLGTGVVGGVGLGLGYISPVSTLLKWFPDRRGMATGMAIMGFGGGAMIGSPLADILMRHYSTPESVGAWETLLSMACIYAVFMTIGSLAYRVPPQGWKPAGWELPQGVNQPAVSRHVHVDQTWKTSQFWLLWLVLCLNVSAGIGVIGVASPMLQEIFGGKLLGIDLTIDQLDKDQSARLAAIAAGFTGLLSLANIAGRFFWASLSDFIGRRAVYTIFFLFGMALYWSAPWVGQSLGVMPFVLVFCLILTMYGGGFATIPAYLADLFGTQMVGAIHGRLLTAWSVAGILGPVLVNYINDAQVRAGIPKSQGYDMTLRVMAGLLFAGLIFNFLVRPVPSRFFMSDKELAKEMENTKNSAEIATDDSGHQGFPVVSIVAFWGLVVVPLCWGIWRTLMQAGTLWGW
mgnify:FL=1